MLDIKLQTFFAAFRQRSMVVIIVIEIHPFMMQAKLVLQQELLIASYLPIWRASHLAESFRFWSFSENSFKMVTICSQCAPKCISSALEPFIT